MPSKKFVIIDGNGIIHRAYHALPPLTDPSGQVVNAVYGFTSMLLKVLNDLKPDYLAISFDVKGPTFRDQMYEAYKAKRIKADQELYDQIPLCYEVVDTFGIPVYTKEGYEADDVIATVAKKLEIGNWKLEIIIVTGDMDLLQLVDNNTHVYALKKGITDMVLYDEKEVKNKYGFGPEHIVDYKALRGDASDNIPGVPGIGEKTATELIQKIGGVEKIYKEIRKLKNYEISDNIIKKIGEGKENAEMSKKLATAVKDIKGLKFDIDECEVKEIDREKIVKLFQKFGFTSLLKRLPKQLAINNEQLTKIEKQKNKKTKKQIELVEIDGKNIQQLITEIGKAGEFACKEIISGTDILNGELMGLVIATEKNSYHILNKNSANIKQIFDNDKITIVGHDLKQLIKSITKLEIGNWKLEIFDIMVASYVLNSSTRAHDLKSIVLRELGKELPDGAEQNTLFGADPKIIAEELQMILEIRKKQQKNLEKMSDSGLFEKMEMPLIPVLAEMELNGVKIDAEKMQELSKIVAHDIEKITKKIWGQAGEEFNVASSAQLRDILFEKLKLPSAEIKKGKTGYSTAEPELEKLLDEHPIIPMILEHRELAKLQSTYVDVLPGLINKKTGRLHTSFNQAVTTTGRLSSSEPNLQNIPARGELGREIRNAFIAEKGYFLISADYSQIELRIVASLAKDRKMMEIFEKDEDIHRATAAAINGMPLEKVTPEMRYAAKEINFGVLYGMGAYGLSWRAGIPRWQADAFIKKYFEEFAGVKKYIDQTLEFAKKQGYVETFFGRRRYIPELKAENFQLRSAGERMAINMPIQGTAADLMKLAMIEVHKKLSTSYQEGAGGVAEVKMILQVHDELVFEVQHGLEEEAAKIIKETMENVVKLNVPVEAHIAIGKRWGDLK